MNFIFSLFLRYLVKFNLQPLKKNTFEPNDNLLMEAVTSGSNTEDVTVYYG